MNWSTPAELREQVLKLWNRGDILADFIVSHAAPAQEERDSTIGLADEATFNSQAATQTRLFPRRLKLRKPASRDLSEHFDAVRNWIRNLNTLPHCRIETRTVKHPVLGENTLPHTVWVDSLDDAIALIGKTRDIKRIRTMQESLQQHDTRLLEWLGRRALYALTLSNNWDRLLLAHAWMKSHPDSGIYIRQVDLQGVDSKFIEAHREVLAQWCDLTLEPNTIHLAYRGVRGFARRYGFLDKPVRMRMRSLDPACSLVTQAGASDAIQGTHVSGEQSMQANHQADAPMAKADITMDVEHAAKLQPAHQFVFITENEVNFLTLPALPDSMAIFGAGYGLDSMASLQWLQNKTVYYWGDIDTHGFAILNELRLHVPAAKSILMDRQTLLDHESMWGSEPKPEQRELSRLDQQESELLSDLLNDHHGHRVRLEQERIGFNYVQAAMQNAIS